MPADHGEGQLLGRGYQGAVYLRGEGTARRVVKQPIGGRLGRSIGRAMLRREFAAYRRLDGMQGVPRCFGLAPDGGLLLEYVEGEPFRENAQALHRQAGARDAFFRAFLDCVLELHRRGVAHGDLKRHGNLLITPEGRPILLDFGTSIVRGDTPGWIRTFLFRQACQMDLNAWVKLKYRRRYDELSAEDRTYYRPTLIESAARVLRKVWRKLSARQLRKALRRRRSR